MSCCCNKIFRVCDVIACDGELVLPFHATADGEHVLELSFLRTQLKSSAMLSIGDALTFELGELNERYTYVGRVLGPDGEAMALEQDGVIYDCIEFTTTTAQWTPSSSSSGS